MLGRDLQYGVNARERPCGNLGNVPWLTVVAPQMQVGASPGQQLARVVLSPGTQWTVLSLRSQYHLPEAQEGGHRNHWVDVWGRKGARGTLQLGPVTETRQSMAGRPLETSERCHAMQRGAMQCDCGWQANAETNRDPGKPTVKMKCG